MSDGLAPETLMAKALRATASARLLLEANDVDGACSRAYYAMFDAARAALLAANAPVPPDIGKTHGGLISAFSLHLVKDGPVSHELGKTLNRALARCTRGLAQRGSGLGRCVTQQVKKAGLFLTKQT